MVDSPTRQRATTRAKPAPEALPNAQYVVAANKFATLLGRHIQGYDDAVQEILMAAVAGGHVLLEGVPGVAKTTLAKAVANLLGLSFQRIQFTQDLLPADVTGHYFFNQANKKFEIRKGPVFANVILADEINRAPAKTHGALLEAMEEGQVTIEGTTLALPSPFFVLATLNPVDTEGVYRLPEAQLDRFLVRTRLGYLDANKEVAILQAEQSRVRNQPIKAFDASFLLQAQRDAQDVVVMPPMLQYMQRLAAATRSHAGVRLGASPRSMVQLLRASRARALLQGRGHVIPDDVKWVAPRVLAHRILLQYDAEEAGTTRDGIVADVMRSVEVPKGLAA